MKAALVLEDGSVFEGFAFGKAGTAFGETVFYTGVVGYQEVVTNPSYRGTLAVLTYPMIGSYGVSAADDQSEHGRAAGVIIRDYSPHFSNFRAEGDFEAYLKREGIVGLCGIDTRALAVHLRENGEMKGMIVSGDFDLKKTAQKVKKSPSPFESDLAEDWSISLLKGKGKTTLALVDVGATANLLSQLADLGFTVSQAGVDVARVKSAKAAAVIVAGGPGDPRNANGAAKALESLIGGLPVLGIGLGHSLVALSLGCSVSRMRVGHHGVNHSVRNLDTGKCIITAQHHSFAVEASVPAGVEVTHINVNDASVEGITSPKAKARGLQFELGRDDMGAPSPILDGFVKGKDA